MIFQKVQFYFHLFQVPTILQKLLFLVHDVR